MIGLRKALGAALKRGQKRGQGRGRRDGMRESLFCRPGGLPGGAAPDVGDGATGVARGVGDPPPPPSQDSADSSAAAPAQASPGNGGGKRAGGRRGSALKAGPRLLAVLDTNTAVMYGRYASDEMEHRIPEEFRDLLRSKSVKRVVTPAVMNEVRGLCRSRRLPREAADRIGALAVKSVGSGAEIIAGMIEAEQRMVAEEAKSDTAMRWLAAKRVQYRDATGTDYGNPGAISVRSRRKHLARLCDMAADDRAIMGEAAMAAARHRPAVLLSADADVSLFAGALKRATGGGLDVVGIEREPRRNQGGWRRA